MNKKKIYILLIVSVLIFIFIAMYILLISNISNNFGYRNEYETWIDTKNTFGNGEYQQYLNNNGGLDLFNMKYNCPIINSVINYIEKEDKVFFVGYIYDKDNNSLKVLAILYLKDNLLKFYTVDHKFEEYMILYSPQMITDNKLIIVESFEDFSSEEQDIFNSLG